MGMRIGYARVSSSGQRLDVQLDRLTDCDRIFSEKASAASAKGRPELQKALDYVRDEDVFVVTKLDRLALRHQPFISLSALYGNCQKDA